MTWYAYLTKKGVIKVVHCHEDSIIFEPNAVKVTTVYFANNYDLALEMAKVMLT